MTLAIPGNSYVIVQRPGGNAWKPVGALAVSHGHARSRQRFRPRLDGDSRHDQAAGVDHLAHHRPRLLGEGQRRQEQQTRQRPQTSLQDHMTHLFLPGFIDSGMLPPCLLPVNRAGVVRYPADAMTHRYVLAGGFSRSVAAAATTSITADP